MEKESILTMIDVMVLRWDLDFWLIDMFNNGFLVWSWFKWRYKEGFRCGKLYGFIAIPSTVSVIYCNFWMVSVLILSCSDLQVLSFTFSLDYILHTFPKWCKPSLDDCGIGMYSVLFIPAFEVSCKNDCSAWCEPSSDDVWAVLFLLWPQNLGFGWFFYVAETFASGYNVSLEDIVYETYWLRYYFGYSGYKWRDKGVLFLMNYVVLEVYCCGDDKLLD